MVDQSHGARRIRSSSSDAATVRCDAGERDLDPSDSDASTQPRRISDPTCHAAASTSGSGPESAAATATALGRLTTPHHGSRSQQPIGEQRRRLETEEVRQFSGNFFLVRARGRVCPLFCRTRYKRFAKFDSITEDSAETVKSVVSELIPWGLYYL